MPTNFANVLETISYLSREIINDYDSMSESGTFLASTLRVKQLENDEVEAIIRNEDANCLAVVARGQDLPIMGHGQYSRLAWSPPALGGIKLFNEKQLSNLLSPDKTRRNMARNYIAEESKALLDSGYKTLEKFCWQAFVVGAIAYRSPQDPRMIMNINYPIQMISLAATTYWGATDQASVVPITNMHAWIKEFGEVTGYKPAKMRMTTDTFFKLAESTQVSTRITNWVQNARGDIVAHDPVELAKFLGWPPIELQDNTMLLHFVTKNAESSSTSPVVIEVKDAEAFNLSFLNVGDTAYIGAGSNAGGFYEGSWKEKQIITAINPGVSLTVEALTNTHAAGIDVFVRSTFMPHEYIQLIDDRNPDHFMIGEAPYGVDLNGPQNLYGWEADAFMYGNQPNNNIAHRVRNVAFPMMVRPKRVMRVKVRDIANE